MAVAPKSWTTFGWNLAIYTGLPPPRASVETLLPAVCARFARRGTKRAKLVHIIQRCAKAKAGRQSAEKQICLRCGTVSRISASGPETSAARRTLTDKVLPPAFPLCLLPSGHLHSNKNIISGQCRARPGALALAAEGHDRPEAPYLLLSPAKAVLSPRRHPAPQPAQHAHVDGAAEAPEQASSSSLLLPSHPHSPSAFETFSMASATTQKRGVFSGESASSLALLRCWCGVIGFGREARKARSTSAVPSAFTVWTPPRALRRRSPLASIAV